MADIKQYVKAAEEKMTSAIDYLDEQLAHIRAGKANPKILDSVRVMYYGAPVPLSNVATVTVPDARTIMITPWEKKIIKDIEKGIMDSDVGITPENNGEVIRLGIPPLTEERRRSLVKQSKQESENAKISIRNARRDAIDALKKITSTSSQNVSVVVAEFELEKSIEIAANDVRDKVSTISFGSEVKSPIIEKFDVGGTPIISLFVSSKTPISNTKELLELNTHTDLNIKPLLQRIAGVGKVNLVGFLEREIRILPNPTMLSKYNLSYLDVAQAIKAQNIEIDGGRIIDSKQEWTILTKADAENIQELGDLLIAKGVKLSDIAVIEDTMQEQRSFSYLHSKDIQSGGILLEIQKITGANEIEITKATAVTNNVAMREKFSLARFFKIPADCQLICFDDMSLPLGDIRLRPSGSAGGQKGMKNIIELSGTDKIARLRVGIGPRPERFDAADFVLSRFSKTEFPALERALDKAVQALETYLTDGLEKAMNRFN